MITWAKIKKLYLFNLFLLYFMNVIIVCTVYKDRQGIFWRMVEKGTNGQVVHEQPSYNKIKS